MKGNQQAQLHSQRFVSDKGKSSENHLSELYERSRHLEHPVSDEEFVVLISKELPVKYQSLCTGALTAVQSPTDSTTPLYPGYQNRDYHNPPPHEPLVNLFATEPYQPADQHNNDAEFRGVRVQQPASPTRPRDEPQAASQVYDPKKLPKWPDTTEGTAVNNAALLEEARSCVESRLILAAECRKTFKLRELKIGQLVLVVAKHVSKYWDQVTREAFSHLILDLIEW
ncbi:hypothetical protein PR048_015825 [Dryococelus australis]|uniref:Uncharacterized protein n=1 Tax=Dryococelus australis TaxID=614101 RepID=A0ABQ9HI34_9NEOP|nr:hypothetical protein PR048_015825 [Dryococelus australis]